MQYIRTPQGFFAQGQSGLVPITDPVQLRDLNGGNTPYVNQTAAANVASPTGTASAAPQQAPTPSGPAPTQSGGGDSYSKFSTALMQILSGAQQAGNTAPLYAARDQMNNQALNLSNPMNDTPYKELFAHQAPLVAVGNQQETQRAFQPGITSITSQIQAQNDAAGRVAQLANVATQLPMVKQEADARATVLNFAQAYPDAGITQNDDLATAQRKVAESPSFQAKQVVYAIDPLTGQPVLIDKKNIAGGGGAPTTSPTQFGGGSQPTGPSVTAPQGNGTGTVDTSGLRPELRASIQNVGGVQFFDASTLNSSQLPYAQRASVQYGIPLLSKDDANIVQQTYSAFTGAGALVDQIKNLTKNVIKAQNSPVDMTQQAAYLGLVEKFPTLFGDNDAKQFISARNSVLSLITRAAGEKGTLTTQDVQRIQDALPSYSDNAELGAQKAKNLTNVLNSVFKGSVAAYIGTKTGNTQAPQTQTSAPSAGTTPGGVTYTINP